MTSADPDVTSKPSVMRRFGKGVSPIVIVCILLWSLGTRESSDPMAVAVVFALCAIVLWFGWSGIQRNLATKWLGIVVALCVGVVLSLFVFGIVVRLSPLLLVLLLVALPFLVYDLVFRSRFKGRFARARAERRHLRPRS